MGIARIDSPERGKELKFKGLGSARERLWCGCGCEEEDVVIARGVEDQRTRGEEENAVAIDGDDWMERGRMAEEEEVVEQWILWQRYFLASDASGQQGSDSCQDTWGGWVRRKSAYDAGIGGPIVRSIGRET
ncbi:hypothetical protein QL285_023764 [Trifolium repens]|nr:hypothetical protein QL285_023764 [Trifolium repens]